MTNLEKDCDRCNGTCMVLRLNHIEKPDNDKKMYCPNCEGTGKVPSENGRALINFILKYQCSEHWERS